MESALLFTYNDLNAFLRVTSWDFNYWKDINVGNKVSLGVQLGD